jgi:hypothetical protein
MVYILAKTPNLRHVVEIPVGGSDAVAYSMYIDSVYPNSVDWRSDAFEYVFTPSPL